MHLPIATLLVDSWLDISWESVQGYAGEAGLRALRVAVVLAFALLVFRLIKRFANRAISRWAQQAEAVTDADERGRLQRRHTLLSVFLTTAKVLVFVMAALYVMPQVGIEYGPLLVAAGGVSLAVGFGAQYLVRDFFSGFFVLLENQYVIGDVVEVNGREGTVEDINLRTTVLRDFNGNVYIIPNGEIRIVANKTRNWSRAIVDVGVSYDADVDRAARALREAGEDLRKDKHWSDKVIADVLVAGVQELSDNAVVMRVLIKVQPGEQWAVAREYRRRVKCKLEDAGISIPYPHRVISYRKEEPKEKAERIAEEESARHEASPEQADRAAAVSLAASKPVPESAAALAQKSG